MHNLCLLIKVCATKLYIAVLANGSKLPAQMFIPYLPLPSLSLSLSLRYPLILYHPQLLPIRLPIMFACIFNSSKSVMYELLCLGLMCLWGAFHNDGKVCALNIKHYSWQWFENNGDWPGCLRDECMGWCKHGRKTGHEGALHKPTWYNSGGMGMGCTQHSENYRFGLVI